MLQNWVINRKYYLTVITNSIFNIFAVRQAINRFYIQVQVLAQFFHYHGNPAGVIKIFHQEFTRWHQVYQKWDVTADAVKIIEFQFYT